MNEEDVDEQMTQEQFFEGLEDWFGVYVHSNYNEILAAIQRCDASLEVPNLKCPKCGKPMSVTDFENFEDQIDEAKEGGPIDISLNMACLDERCPSYGNEGFLATFRLVEVK